MSGETWNGIYRGICSNDNDPEGLGRIKAICPQVFGNQTTETAWAWPMWWPAGGVQGSGAWDPKVTVDGAGDLTIWIDCDWALDSQGDWWYDPSQTLVAAGATPGYLGPGLELYPIEGNGRARAATAPETPAPKDGVWLAFEGGNINYPLWCGVWGLGS